MKTFRIDTARTSHVVTRFSYIGGAKSTARLSPPLENSQVNRTIVVGIRNACYPFDWRAHIQFAEPRIALRF